MRDSLNMKIDNDSLDVALNFWSVALGVDKQKILTPLVQKTSEGWYRQRSPEVLYLFNCFASGFTAICGPEGQLEKISVSHPGFSEESTFSLAGFSQEFDDLDYFLSDPKVVDSQKKLHEVRCLGQGEVELLKDLLRSCSEDESDTFDVEIEELNKSMYCHGFISGGKLLGAARYYVIPRTDRLTDITLLTRPANRGHGIGKALLGSLLTEILAKKLIPRYRVKVDNLASQKVAESLGFVKFNRIRVFHSQK